MGKKSKAKGYNGEHEVVKLCEEQGIFAERKFMSGLFDPLGTDVVIGIGPDARNVSIKRRANGMGWAYEELERADYVLFRADNKKWLKIEVWEHNKRKERR